MCSNFWGFVPYAGFIAEILTMLCCQEGVTSHILMHLTNTICQTTLIEPSCLWTLNDIFAVPSAANMIRPIVLVVIDPAVSNPGRTGGHLKCVSRASLKTHCIEEHLWTRRAGRKPAQKAISRKLIAWNRDYALWCSWRYQLLLLSCYRKDQ